MTSCTMPPCIFTSRAPPIRIIGLVRRWPHTRRSPCPLCILVATCIAAPYLHRGMPAGRTLLACHTIFLLRPPQTSLSFFLLQRLTLEAGRISPRTSFTFVIDT